MKIDINKIGKELNKTKADATFSHYQKGNLYYDVEVNGGLYRFPISVVDYTEERMIVPTIVGPIVNDIEIMKLSADLGDTNFESVIPGRLLIRYIDKANIYGDFVLVRELVKE